MLAVTGFLFLVALFAAHEVDASCKSISDCGSCVDHATFGIHSCYWCQLDVACHSVGSAVSACTPAGADDDCISKSGLSQCSQTSAAQCSADDPKKPRQIHLAVAGPGGMRVAWKTRGVISDSHVVFSSDLGQNAGAKVTAERSLQYLEGFGFHHVAKLTGLSPGHSYQYRVVSDGVTSSVRSFEVPATDLAKATFLVVGDMGYAEWGQAAASRKKMDEVKGSTDLTIHLGDVGYADDTFMHPSCSAEFCFENGYDNFMEWMENVTDTKPYMVMPGNHESECHSPACLLSATKREALRNFSAYNARWAMPSQESGGVASMWYSFDYGPVHFVVVNTETDFPDAASETTGACIHCGLAAGSFAPNGAYLQWLEADLQLANKKRATRPFVVALGHRPWLWQNGTDFIDAPGVKAAHANLFEKYGVDLFMAGHIHAYHRVSPTNGGMPTIVSGGAGSDEGFDDPWAAMVGPKTGTIDTTGKTAEVDYRIFTTDHQIGTLEATRTSLTWKAIASGSGKIIDTVTVNKKSHSVSTVV